MKPNPIIVALDVESAEEARALVARLGRAHRLLQGRAWNCTPPPAWSSCANCSAQGKDVFLDLKLYDIPETVKRAVAQVARTGVRFLTVHAVGSVMRAAVEGARRVGSRICWR